MLLRLFISIACLFAVFSATAQERHPLTIHTANGPRIFQVQLADTPQTRARGLMFVREMPQEHGMLFDFGKEKHVSFWMRNTYIPLDMIFADALGTITHIHHNAIPHDESGIPSRGPILGVLEINAGLSRFLGIQVGDSIDHPIFIRNR